MTETILAIDIGTSSIKLLLVSRDGDVLARRRISHDTSHPVPEAAEQDPDVWWSNLADGIRHVTRVIRAGISALAVTGQMHGLVVHDAQGHVLRPAITWQDRRSESTLPHLLDSLAPVTPPVSAGFQAASWHWLAQAEPAVGARAQRVLLPKDEIIYRLTDRHVTDPSDAVGTGWFDPIAGTWDRRTVETAGARIDLLPEIVPSGSIVGELPPHAAMQLGLTPGIPVVIAGGDAAVGAFGAGATHESTPLLMLSTGCQLLVPTDETPSGNDHRWALWPAATVPGHAPWLRVGATLNGGSAIGWARSTFGDHLAPPDDSGPMFVPYLAGERFPVSRSSSTGAFFHLGGHHGPGHLLRAVFDGVALATADALAAMGGALSTDVPLLVGGGGVRDDAWVAAISTAFDRPLRVVSEADLSAWGAARLAASCLGWMDPNDEPEAWLPPIGEIERPAMAEGMALSRLERFRLLAKLVGLADEGGNG